MYWRSSGPTASRMNRRWPTMGKMRRIVCLRCTMSKRATPTSATTTATSAQPHHCMRSPRCGAPLLLDAAPGELGFHLRVLAHVLLVQLLGCAHDAVDLQLAHDVDLAEGRVEVLGSVARRD